MESTRKPVTALILVVAIFAAATLALLRTGGDQEPEATSAQFMPVTTDLSAMAFEGDKPIVAVVTADWCAPCQQLKRGALSDERVRALLVDRAQPVMIDGTVTSDAMPTLERLGVRAFPSTVVLRKGEPVAMLEGYANTDRYLAWLEANL